MIPRRTARSNWLLMLALAAVLLAGLYIAPSRVGGVPPDGATVLYPLLLLYNYTALPLATTLLLLALLVVVLWVPQAMRRAPRYRLNGAAAGLLSLAAVLACVASLPHLFVGYLHAARAELNGRVFQLGIRTAVDGANNYVLCDCDKFGLVCRCRALPEAGPPNFVVPPKLVADPVGRTLTIAVGTEVVYTVSP